MEKRLAEYSNVRTYEGEDGRTYVHREDALTLARRLADKNRELLERLSQQ